MKKQLTQAQLKAMVEEAGLEILARLEKDGDGYLDNGRCAEGAPVRFTLSTLLDKMADKLNVMRISRNRAWEDLAAECFKTHRAPNLGTTFYTL